MAKKKAAGKKTAKKVKKTAKKLKKKVTKKRPAARVAKKAPKTRKAAKKTARPAAKKTAARPKAAPKPRVAAAPPPAPPLETPAPVPVEAPPPPPSSALEPAPPPDETIAPRRERRSPTTYQPDSGRGESLFDDDFGAVHEDEHAAEDVEDEDYVETEEEDDFGDEEEAEEEDDEDLRARPASPPPATPRTVRGRTGADVSGELRPGMPAPDFALPDQQGRMQTLASYRGKMVVLYFYPKDDTPGCTVEACGFRDTQRSFAERGAVVLGVSPDSIESHAHFMEKHQLNFPLLADESHAVAARYGVWGRKPTPAGQKMGVHRTSFLIDEAGRIAHIFRNVKPDGHEEEVLERIDEARGPIRRA